VLGDEPQLRCKRSSKADVAKPFGEAESFLHNVKETPSLRAGGGFISVFSQEAVIKILKK